MLKNNKLILAIALISTIIFGYYLLSPEVLNVYNVSITGNIFFIKLNMLATEGNSDANMTFVNWILIVVIIKLVVDYIKAKKA